MAVDWSSAETALMGGAWIGSQASEHIYKLADSIGIRWAGTDAEGVLPSTSDHVSMSTDWWVPRPKSSI